MLPNERIRIELDIKWLLLEEMLVRVLLGISHDNLDKLGTKFCAYSQKRKLKRGRHRQLETYTSHI